MTDYVKVRILFAQPSLQPPGGGNGVAAWMIQALRGHHQLTVLTWAEVGLGEINRHFGTSLCAGDATFVRSHPRLASILARAPLTADLFKTSLFMRDGRRRAAAFDLAISANNEADLGSHTLQYVNYPRYERPRPRTERRWFHLAPALWAYYRLSDAAAGISFPRMRANRTLVNSAWTGRLVKRLHGIDADILHPPIVISERPTEWETREDAFVCLGRIAPEKEIEKVISILERVRALGHPVGLTIAGSPGPKGYVAAIQEQVQRRADWIRLEFDLPRPRVERLLVSHRYGIHGMSEEHFGMAPAEMASAGCIVFVPGGGGQMEIVHDDPRLVYTSENDAVEKIGAVLGSSELRGVLRMALADSVTRFGVEAFSNRLRGFVTETGGRPGAKG